MELQIVFNSTMKIIEEKYPEIHHEKLQTVFVPYVMSIIHRNSLANDSKGGLK